MRLLYLAFFYRINMFIMKKYLILFILWTAFLSCKSVKNETSVFTIKSSENYKVPVFDDIGRLDKIRKTFGVIDSIFKDAALKNNYPGLAIGIVVDGELVHNANFGYTDIDKKIPVTSSSMFRIASMSKSFTSLAILHLRDLGKLNLDDPVGKYIPEMANQISLTSDAPQITIRHCLSHNTGLPEDNPWGDRQLQDSDKELLALLDSGLAFSNIPGVAYEYSNLGFALLGRIITKVSGMPYQQYIKKNILMPLNMSDTDWEYSHIDRSRLALGYRWLDGKYRDEALLHDNPDGSWGAMGAMISSIDEFARYMSLHLSAWPPRSGEDKGPVGRTSVREMHKPWNFSGFNPNYKYPDGRTCATANAYGYGLRWTKDCDDKLYIGHSGGLPGFGSQWQIMPDYGIGVVSLANRTYAGTGGVNMQVLDYIVKNAGLKPRYIPTSDILNIRKNELMALLPDWIGAESSGIFAENFFPDFILPVLKKQSQDLFSRAGKILKIQDFVADNQLRGTFIIEGQNTNLQVYFTLTPENPPLIQEYRIREVNK